MHKIVLSLCLVLALSAAADDFSNRLEAANELLKSGATAKALEAYRDLQVDRPESDILQFNTGCAHYMDGLADVELDARQQAAAAFEKSADCFEKVSTSTDANIRRKAGYFRAGALAEAAKVALPPDWEKGGGSYQENKKAGEALERAIEGYKDFLRSYPDHEQAKQNLDYLKFCLSKVQSTLSKKKQEEKQGESSEEQGGQSQEEERDEQQQQAKQEQSDQQDQQQEQQPQPDQQQNQQRDQQPQPDQQQQQEQEQEQQAEQSGDEQQAPEAQAEQSEDQLNDRQNVEAILQSLEDLDKQEQERMRKMRRDIRIDRNWW